MAFLDKLGGLASGLLGGLGEVRQNVEAQRRSTQEQRQQLLQALQERRLQEQQALAEAQMQYSTLEPGVGLDPSDPAVANIIKHLGAGAFVKGSQPGQIMRKMNPQTELAQVQLESVRANQPLETAQRNLQMGEVQDTEALMAGLREKYGQDFRRRLFDSSIPMTERQGYGASLYKKPDFFMTPEEKLKYSEQVAAAALQAQAMGNLRQAQSADIGINNQQAWENQFDKMADNNAELLTLRLRNLPEYLARRQAYVASQMGNVRSAAPSGGGVVVYDENGNRVQ